MLIAPSVLSFDYPHFERDIVLLNKYADWLHFDVMDGHFVPNISFGPDILKAFKKSSGLFMDVHLMIADPLFFLEAFKQAGADLITFHYEALNDDQKIKELIQAIKMAGLKVGISIKPKTEVSVLEPYLDLVDLVLIMSVEPGFGGQSFIEGTYQKIKALQVLKKDRRFLIEVDGGVNDQNAKELKALHVDVLVAGSYVFKGDIQERIASLK